MSDWEDAATASPLSSPPESIFDLQEDEMAAHGKAAQTAKDGPSLLTQLKAMEEETIAVKSPDDDMVKAKAKADDDVSTTSPPTIPPVTGGRKRKASTAPIRRIVISKKARNEAKKWESPFVYTDPKTPLANSDLRAILLNSRAWDVLSHEEQQQVLRLLPGHTHVLAPGTEQPRPDVNSLRNSDTFRFDSARYCENIEAGKHDPDWLQSAWVAHEKRNRGDFDEYQVKQFEKTWAVKISPEHHPKALRNEGQTAPQSVRSDSIDPATTEKIGLKASEEAKKTDNRDQCPSSDGPEPTSPTRSYSSMEKKIANVDITREEPNESCHAHSLPGMKTHEEVAESIEVKMSNPV